MGSLTPGETLREARKARGLTQVEFAAMIGINSSYLSQLECGRRGARESHLLQLLEQWFGIDPSAMLAIPELPRKPKRKKKPAKRRKR